MMVATVVTVLGGDGGLKVTVLAARAAVAMPAAAAAMAAAATAAAAARVAGVLIDNCL